MYTLIQLNFTKFVYTLQILLISGAAIILGIIYHFHSLILYFYCYLYHFMFFNFFYSFSKEDKKIKKKLKIKRISKEDY